MTPKPKTDATDQPPETLAQKLERIGREKAAWEAERKRLLDDWYEDKEGCDEALSRFMRRKGRW